MLDVWDEVHMLERRLDDMARGFFGRRPRRSLRAKDGFATAAFMPATDVFARNGDLVVDVELPGVDLSKDVKVTLEDGDLVIRGERRHTEEVQEEDYYRSESTYGAFERHIAVPDQVAEADVAATYKDGILEICVHGAGAKASASPAPAPIPIEVKSS